MSVSSFRQVADGVVEIDTLLGGWERVTAGYLLDGTAPALVETGSQSSVPVLLAALEEIGVAPDQLASVVVTHIHLDHAGGVGDVARAFPSATVYVHEKGARHLVDPSRLVDSATRVYGPLLDSLYGRLEPTEASRVVVLGDGERLAISSDRYLEAIDSPGHAKHHLGLLDSRSGVLFAGDAAGVRLPDSGVLRPASPPPDFDRDQALDSLRRFAEKEPSALALAHYGIVAEPQALLAEAAEVLMEWSGIAERAWKQGRDIASALETELATQLEAVDPEQREKLETLNGIHSNAAGFQRWLDKRQETSQTNSVVGGRAGK